MNSEPSDELGRKALALAKYWGLGIELLRAMVVIREQDALELQQLSPKLICTRVITIYGKLHYSTLIRVVESCTMVLIQHNQVAQTPLICKFCAGNGHYMWTCATCMEYINVGQVIHGTDGRLYMPDRLEIL